MTETSQLNSLFLLRPSKSHEKNDPDWKRNYPLSLLCILWIAFMAATIYILEQQVWNPTARILDYSLIEKFAQACISLYSTGNGILLTFLGYETALYVLRWKSIGPKSIRAYFRLHDREWSNPFTIAKLLFLDLEQRQEVGLWFFVLTGLYFVGLAASLIVGNAYSVEVCFNSISTFVSVSGPNVSSYSALQTYDIISSAQGVMATAPNPLVTYNSSYYKSATTVPNVTTFWAGSVNSSFSADGVFGLVHDVSCNIINQSQFSSIEARGGFRRRLALPETQLFNLRLNVTLLLFSLSDGFMSNNSLVKGLPVSEDIYLSINETIDSSRTERRAYQCHFETKAGLANIDGLSRTYTNFRQTSLLEQPGEPVDSPAVAFTLGLSPAFNSSSDYINSIRLINPLGYRIQFRGRNQPGSQVYYTSVSSTDQAKSLENVMTSVGAASVATNAINYTTTGTFFTPVTCRRGNRGLQVAFILMASLEIVWLLLVAILFAGWHVHGHQLDVYRVAQFLNAHGDNFESFKRTFTRKDK